MEADFRAWWLAELGTNGQLRWRAEEDKVGREWWAPVTPEVREELERLRRERPGVGEALLFPAPNDASRPVTVQIASDWLRHAEKLAKLEPLPGGRGIRSAGGGRRSESTFSPKDVAAVGGWVDTTTLQKCYQVGGRGDDGGRGVAAKRLKRVG